MALFDRSYATYYYVGEIRRIHVFAAAAGPLLQRQICVYVAFPRHKIPPSNTYTVAAKAVRFQQPYYNPDRAQKLISLSMSRHLSTRNISSKSMNAFLSNLANRQTDRQMRALAFTSSSVGGK